MTSEISGVLEGTAGVQPCVNANENCRIDAVVVHTSTYIST